MYQKNVGLAIIFCVNSISVHATPSTMYTKHDVKVVFPYKQSKAECKGQSLVINKSK